MVLAQRADARDAAFDLGFGRGKQVQRLKRDRHLAGRPGGLRAGKQRIRRRPGFDFVALPCKLVP
jgi:hypothetical protein